MSDYTNSGVLFRNDRKEKDSQPDYTGKINVDGRELRLAAWLKAGKKGKFMSLKVSEDREQPRGRQESAPDLDDEIIF